MKKSALQKVQEFRENAADFLVHNGLKLAGGALLCSSAFIFSQPFWDWEHANLIRSFVAAPAMALFYTRLMRSKNKEDRQSAYGWGVVGGTVHTVANCVEGLPVNAVTWGVFTAAAASGSKPVQERKSAAAQKCAAFKENKQDIIGRFQHRIAAFTRLGLSVAQWLEANQKNKAALMVYAGLCIVGSGLYVAQALAEAMPAKKNTIKAD